MKRSIPIILLCTLVLLPALVRAQTEGQWYLRGSSDLQEKIDALPEKAVRTIHIPVLFGVALKNISPNFGDPRSGGRSHEGEDIMARQGTPIVSPTDAVVLRTTDGSSSGLTVYTANPGGETFVYMHLDAIGEDVDAGDVLERGSLIGYVGYTGNAVASAPHLHFEIHDADGNPTDPYPRITKEFTLEDKMTYLSDMLDQSADSEALIVLLVKNFRSTFVAAQKDGVVLHDDIVAALGGVGVSPAPTKPVVLGTMPKTDGMVLGSTGTEVATLQTFLIQANSGVAARQLAAVGATGYFGALTQTALREYQATQVATVVTPKPTSTTVVGILTRTLSLTMTGEDVRTLQKILNANGYAITASGAGSSGNETTYFGAATQAAVIRFQRDKGIAPAAGLVGPVTRAALNAL